MSTSIKNLPISSLLLSVFLIGLTAGVVCTQTAKELENDIGIYLKHELETSGVEAAERFWRNHFVLQLDPFDDSVAIDKVLPSYNIMLRLLGFYREQCSHKRNKEQFDVATDREIVILQEMIQKFPDSKHTDVFAARLRLGYLVLNRSNSSPGALSGIMTPERINKINLLNKENAEKAEPIFRELKEVAKGTNFEKNAVKALTHLEQLKNPKLYDMQDNTEKNPIEELIDYYPGKQW